MWEMMYMHKAGVLWTIVLIMLNELSLLVLSLYDACRPASLYAVLFKGTLTAQFQL